MIWTDRANPCQILPYPKKGTAMAGNLKAPETRIKIAQQVGAVHPWPDVLPAPSPVESILYSRAQSYRTHGDWSARPCDLIELARMVQMQAMAIEAQRQLATDGLLWAHPTTGRKSPSPLVEILSKLNQQINAQGRKLGVGSLTQAEKNKLTSHANFAADAKQTYGGEDSDSLLN